MKSSVQRSAIQSQAEFYVQCDSSLKICDPNMGASTSLSLSVTMHRRSNQN